MATKLYPIGMQTFSEIREEDFLYVDKTEYIYRMTHTSGKYFFLARPRRFGKSLLVSTMQSYFEGKKELFKGLAVEKLEKEWTEYSVLHFDMSGGKHMEPEQLELYLGYILEDQEKKWGINEPRIGANNRLIDLINTAYEKSGKQVVRRAENKWLCSSMNMMRLCWMWLTRKSNWMCCAISCVTSLVL